MTAETILKLVAVDTRFTIGYVRLPRKSQVMREYLRKLNDEAAVEYMQNHAPL